MTDAELLGAEQELHDMLLVIRHLEEELNTCREARLRLTAKLDAAIEVLRFVYTDPCYRLLGSVTHDKVKEAINA